MLNCRLRKLKAAILAACNRTGDRQEHSYLRCWTKVRCNSLLTCHSVETVRLPLLRQVISLGSFVGTGVPAHLSHKSWERTTGELMSFLF